MNRENLNFIDLRNPPAFDLFDESHVEHVIEDKALRDILQRMLVARFRIKQAEGSFGVDKSKACELLLPLVDELQAHCEQQWRLGW